MSAVAVEVGLLDDDERRGHGIRLRLREAGAVHPGAQNSSAIVCRSAEAFTDRACLRSAVRRLAELLNRRMVLNVNRRRQLRRRLRCRDATLPA